MQRPQEDIFVRCAPGEGVPENGAHVWNMAVRLLLRDHPEYATAIMRVALNLARNGKDEFSDPVIEFDFLADRQEISLEGPFGDAVKNSGRGGSFGGPVCSANPILIQPARPRVSNEYHTVGKRLRGSPNVYLRITVAVVFR